MEGFGGFGIVRFDAGGAVRARAAERAALRRAGAARYGALALSQAGGGFGTSVLVWERIVEAAQTLKRLPDRERGMLRNGATAWPDFLRKAIEAYGYSGPARARLVPSPGAIDRMEETLGWLIAWPRREDMRVVILLASGVRVPEVLRAVERFEGKRIRRQALYERKAAALRRIVAKLLDAGIGIEAPE